MVPSGGCAEAAQAARLRWEFVGFLIDCAWCPCPPADRSVTDSVDCGEPSFRQNRYWNPKPFRLTIFRCLPLVFSTTSMKGHFHARRRRESAVWGSFPRHPSRLLELASDPQLICGGVEKS